MTQSNNPFSHLAEMQHFTSLAEVAKNQSYVSLNDYSDVGHFGEVVGSDKGNIENLCRTSGNCLECGR